MAIMSLRVEGSVIVRRSLCKGHGCEGRFYTPGKPFRYDNPAWHPAGRHDSTSVCVGMKCRPSYPYGTRAPRGRNTNTSLTGATCSSDLLPERTKLNSRAASSALMASLTLERGTKLEKKFSTSTC